MYTADKSKKTQLGMSLPMEKMIESRICLFLQPGLILNLYLLLIIYENLEIIFPYMVRLKGVNYLNEGLYEIEFAMH